MNELERLRMLADSGDVAANFELGLAYWGAHASGPLHNTPEDDALAVKYFKKAAQNGELAACDYLAEAYRSGRGVKKNRASARHWAKMYDRSGAIRDADLYEKRKEIFEGAASVPINLLIWWSRSECRIPSRGLVFAALAIMGVIFSLYMIPTYYYQEKEAIEDDKSAGHDPFTMDAKGNRSYRSALIKKRNLGIGWVASAAAIGAAGAYFNFGRIADAMGVVALLTLVHGAYKWFSSSRTLSVIWRDEAYRKLDTKNVGGPSTPAPRWSSRSNAARYDLELRRVILLRNLWSYHFWATSLFR